MKPLNAFWVTLGVMLTIFLSCNLVHPKLQGRSLLPKDVRVSTTPYVPQELPFNKRDTIHICDTVYLSKFINKVEKTAHDTTTQVIVMKPDSLVVAQLVAANARKDKIIDSMRTAKVNADKQVKVAEVKAGTNDTYGVLIKGFGGIVGLITLGFGLFCYYVGRKDGQNDALNKLSL